MFPAATGCWRRRAGTTVSTAEQRAAVVAEARRWIGTPYQHQASKPGIGSDCLGLVRGVWRALRGPEPVVIPAYGADWMETGGVEVLRIELARCMTPVDGPAASGQVLLFRMRAGSVAKHLGIQTETGPAARFVHAYSGHGVVESPLTRPWARRIVARFEMF